MDQYLACPENKSRTMNHAVDDLSDRLGPQAPRFMTFL
jgi:hypothetical protein